MQPFNPILKWSQKLVKNTYYIKVYDGTRQAPTHCVEQTCASVGLNELVHPLNRSAWNLKPKVQPFNPKLKWSQKLVKNTYYIKVYDGTRQAPTHCVEQTCASVGLNELVHPLNRSAWNLKPPGKRRC